MKRSLWQATYARARSRRSKTTSARPRRRAGARPLACGGLAGGLAEQAEDALGALVGLGEHGRAGLGEDLELGLVDHLLGDVDVADAALGAGEVLLEDADVVDRVLEPVLHGAQRGAGRGDRGDGGVGRGDVRDADGAEVDRGHRDTEL